MAVVAPADGTHGNEGVVMANWEPDDLSENPAWQALTEECPDCDGYGYRWSEIWVKRDRERLQEAKDSMEIVFRPPEEREPWSKCGGCKGLGRRLTKAGYSLLRIFHAHLEEEFLGPGDEVQPT